MSKRDESSLEIPELLSKMGECLHTALIVYDEGYVGDILIELIDIRRLSDIVVEKVKTQLCDIIDPDDLTP